MIVIKFNGKKLEVTAPEERVLRILKRNNFAAKKAEFVEGSSPRYQNTILPKRTRRQKEVPWSRRLAFFRENPRCQSGIFGNPRRINAILKRLDAELDEQIRQENENDKRYDEQRANNLDYNWRNN